MKSRMVELWRHREILRLLIRRDMTVKYQQSVLGYVWSLVEPVALGAIYWFVFGVLYDTPIGPEGESYPLFLVSGLFAWMWVNSSLSESTSALTSQSRLISTMRVPREVFPISRVIGRFAEYLAGVPILVLFAVIFGGHFGLSLLALPLALLMQAALLSGVALMLASLNVILRDVERMVRLAQRLLFYAAPIIYPLHKVTDSNAPEWLKNTYLANPLVGIFQLHHGVFFPSELPSLGLFATSAAGCTAVFVGGWWAFHQLEPAVLKEL